MEHKNVLLLHLFNSASTLRQPKNIQFLPSMFSKLIEKRSLIVLDRI